MANEFSYDVFIAHSAQDRDWVKQVFIPRLEAWEIKVCVDFRDFKSGLQPLHNQLRATHLSRKTLIVWTENFLKHEWRDFQALFLESKVIANSHQKFILLLKEPGLQRPDSLTEFPTINLSKPYQQDAAWQHLLTELERSSIQEIRSGSWLINWPYSFAENFTGRVTARRTLNHWLNENVEHNLLLLRSSEGAGKSALAWHWLTHDVEIERWTRVVWWHFSCQPSHEFESCVLSILNYFDVKPARQLKQQVEQLLTCLQKPGILLIFDGIERLLKAYQGASLAAEYVECRSRDEPRTCNNLWAEYFLKCLGSRSSIRGKVLLLGRLRPNVLEDQQQLLPRCQEMNLPLWSTAEAITYLHRRGIQSDQHILSRISEFFPLQPLSLKLLAGFAMDNLVSPRSIQASLQLPLTRELQQNYHELLQAAYSNLGRSKRDYLERIVCNLGPLSWEDLRASAAENIFFEQDLSYLRERGWLGWDLQRKFIDVSCLVRTHIYTTLGRSERVRIHQELADYFASVQFPDKITNVNDLAAGLSCYRHLVLAEEWQKAYQWFRKYLDRPLYYKLDAYHLRINLLELLLTSRYYPVLRFTDAVAQQWVVSTLANTYSATEQPAESLKYLEGAVNLAFTNDETLTPTLICLATEEMRCGRLPAAEEHYRQGIELAHKSNNFYHEAIANSYSALLFAYFSDWALAQVALSESQKFWKQSGNLDGLCQSSAIQTQIYILSRQENALRSQSTKGLDLAALAAAKRALEYAEEDAAQSYPIEKNFVQAHWLLGATYLLNREFEASEFHLSEACSQGEQLNCTNFESKILLEQARLAAAQGDAQQGRQLAILAIESAERGGDVLTTIDVHLFLGQQAYLQRQRERAMQHAKTAKELAYCDGPPYYYCSAYLCADEMLKHLNI
ncbi:MAG: toll/interleukin-1 receptor domain-containing protein [Cyanobacteria bacterium P01_H01_bin.15]